MEQGHIVRTMITQSNNKKVKRLYVEYGEGGRMVWGGKRKETIISVSFCPKVVCFRGGERAR